MARECTLSEREARHALARLAILMSPPDAPAADLDPIRLHDVRVACRRGRVFLAEFGDNLPDGIARKARKRLRMMGRRLGEPRELDVSIALLREWPAVNAAVRDHALNRLAAERADAQANVAEMQALLASGAIAEALSGVKDAFEPSTACHLRHARARLRKRLRKVQAQHAAWWTSRQDEDLHVLRIQLKTFRYTVEVYRRLYGRPADKFLHTLEAAQDSLGRWNDLRCLRHRVRAMEENAPHALRAGMGELIAAIGTEVDAAQDGVREEIGAFFERDHVKEHHELFGDWSRKCCRGAR